MCHETLHQLKKSLTIYKTIINFHRCMDSTHNKDSTNLLNGETNMPRRRATFGFGHLWDVRSLSRVPHSV